jgi:hypothetical protein
MKEDELPEPVARLYAELLANMEMNEWHGHKMLSAAHRLGKHYLSMAADYGILPEGGGN